MPYPKFYRDIVIFLILIFLSWKVFKKEYSLLEAFAFALPFKYASIEVGFAILLSQGIMTFFIISELVKKLLVKPKNFIVIGPLIFFLLYGLLDTLFVTHYFDIQAIKVTVASSYFREEGRYLLQIVVFIYFYLQIFVVKNFIKSNGQIVKVLNVFLFGLLVLAALGFVQLVMFKVTGLDIFPMNKGFGVNATVRSAVFETLGQQFARVTSLGGEPKGTGTSLALGLSLMVILNRYKIVKSKYYYLQILLFFLIIALTFSTGAYLLFAVFLLIYPIVLLLKFKRPFLLTRKNILVIGLVFSGIAVSFESIYTIIELRVLTKLSRNSSSEASDIAIYDFFQDHPQWLILGSGLGNIHNIAMEYTPEKHRIYMYNTVWVARTGFLRIISELGVVGFCLFLFVVFSAFRNLGMFYNKDNLASGLSLVLIMTFIIFLLRGPYVENEFLLILALAFSYKKERKQTALLTSNI